MIGENDIVKASRNINNTIIEGTVGVVLSVYENGKFFLIEFINNEGETIEDGMETVSREDLILVSTVV